MNYSKTEIEDAIIATLSPLHQDQGGDVKKIAGYQGELDEDNLTQFIIQFPAILVAYVGSTYKEDSFPYMIEEITYSILINGRNMRGNEAARKGILSAGTYSIMQQVRDKLQGERLGLDIRPAQILRETALINTRSVSIYSAEYRITQNYRK